jgi:hypothetical protein
LLYHRDSPTQLDKVHRERRNLEMDDLALPLNTTRRWRNESLGVLHISFHLGFPGVVVSIVRMKNMVEELLCKVYVCSYFSSSGKVIVLGSTPCRFNSLKEAR